MSATAVAVERVLLRNFAQQLVLLEGNDATAALAIGSIIDGGIWIGMRR